MDNKAVEVPEDSLKKTLRFIDEKINKLDQENKVKLKSHEEKLEKSELLLEKHDERIHKLIEEKFNIKKSVVKVRESLSQFLKNQNFLTVIDDVNHRISDIENNLNIDISDINNTRNKDGVKVLQLKEDLRDIEARFRDIEKIGKFLNESFKKIQDDSEENLVKDLRAKQEFEKKTNLLFDDASLKMEQQSSILNSIEKTIQKSYKQVKQESLNLSNEIKDNFNTFAKEYSEDLDMNKKKVKGILDVIDSLKEEIIICKKGGKVDKEIEDFMKQVGYNAKQIEKIHKALEAK